MMQIGDAVHFVLNGGPNRGQDRPAIVVLVADRKINIQVFTDPSDLLPSPMPVTGARESLEHVRGTWHLPHHDLSMTVEPDMDDVAKAGDANG